MKRILISALVIVAALVLTLPGAVGYFAERGHDHVAGRVDQLAAETYERGWFSSRTRYRYRLDDERLQKLAAAITEEPQGEAELVVASRIYHGPVPLLAGGSAPLAWTDVDSSLVLRAPSGAEIPLPGELRSRVQADGSTLFRYHADAESRVLRDGLTVSWDDSDLDVTLGRGADRIAVAGAIGAIRLADDDAALSIGPAAIDGVQQRGRSGLWSGDATIRLESLTAPDFAAGDIRLESRVRESDGQASYALLIEASDLHGAGINGGSAYVDATAQRLDAQAVADLLELVETHRGVGALPPAQRDALLARLLRPGPELTLRKLKLPTPDADLEGEAFFSVTPETGIGIKELARGVEGNTMLLVPMGLIRQIEANGSQEVRNGIELMRRLRVLVPHGNRYRIEAAYAGGLLTVNGFPIPVPVF